MNLLSGLEKFGLDQMDTDHLFEEEKSDTPARKAPDRKSTRLNSSHVALYRMPSSA